MDDKNANNPMHGITLKMILEALVETYGYRKLYEQVEIRCFYINPTLTSSLKFLRKTPWARKKVEEIYLKMIKENRK